MKRERKYADGDRYGRLTIIGYRAGRGYRCVCECGQTCWRASSAFAHPEPMCGACRVQAGQGREALRTKYIINPRKGL